MDLGRMLDVGGEQQPGPAVSREFKNFVEGRACDLHHGLRGLLLYELSAALVDAREVCVMQTSSTDYRRQMPALTSRSSGRSYAMSVKMRPSPDVSSPESRRNGVAVSPMILTRDSRSACRPGTPVHAHSTGWNQVRLIDHDQVVGTDLVGLPPDALDAAEHESVADVLAAEASRVNPAGHTRKQGSELEVVLLDQLLDVRQEQYALARIQPLHALEESGLYDALAGPSRKDQGGLPSCSSK